MGLIAALAFFINYSAIWIIPIWPLAYIFYKRNYITVKNLLVFSFTFLTLTSWFIPIFIKNASLSIEVNQWASDLNFINAFQMFNNYFGLIPMNEELARANPLSIPFLVLFFILIFYKSFSKSKHSYSRAIFFATLISFSLFLLTIYLTKNSLLYPRPAITLIIAFYVLIADALSRIKYSKVIFSLLILMQSCQFILYFNQYQEFSKNYFFTDYRTSTIGYFKDFSFSEDSCLIIFPNWNTTAAKFFLSKEVRVVLSNEMKYEQILPDTEKCTETYILDQFSVDEQVLKAQHLAVLGEGYNVSLVDNYENQNLYILNK
jgi:hypothetical protein